MGSRQDRKWFRFALVLMASCSGCAWIGGSVGEPGLRNPADLASGRTVEVTSVEATAPKLASDVTVSGEIRLVTWDTIYLAGGQALARATIVAVREISKETTFLHDVAMGALAGLAMHVAINGLSPGFH
jgi:hypothetical protein